MVEAADALCEAVAAIVEANTKLKIMVPGDVNPSAFRNVPDGFMSLVAHQLCSAAASTGSRFRSPSTAIAEFKDLASAMRSAHDTIADRLSDTNNGARRA